jgi:hypothetical protein
MTFIKIVLGVAAGYAAARALEARAKGVSIGAAFDLKDIFTPIAKLKKCECAHAAPSTSPAASVPQLNAMPVEDLSAMYGHASNSVEDAN